MFLPWVFAGSGVSTTPQRLWPAAPWTGHFAGTEDREVAGVASSGPSPLDLPKEVRGVSVLPGILEQVLQEHE